ncbi:MAG: acireductone synthase [Gammaproteobacteria bacterium]|nr:acireductone synthase [Gammaproteobacteria bacterium]
MSVRAIVMDIEGTTSSIDFVHKVLFPYAARELPDFVRSHSSDREVLQLLDEARIEAGEASANTERVIEILAKWIEQDRKAGSLKALQGLVWESGYRDGDFTGHVYPDVAPNMKNWVENGIALYVYSSGSVQAQKLLFAHSAAGDLRPFIRGYFDTRTGHKRDAASYKRIAQSLQLTPSQILFLSDTAAELDAATEAGMQTIQLARDKNVVRGAHTMVADFDAISVASVDTE